MLITYNRLPRNSFNAKALSVSIGTDLVQLELRDQFPPPIQYFVCESFAYSLELTPNLPNRSPSRTRSA